MNISKWVSDNAPQILSTLACIGVAVTAFFSAKSVPKAQKSIEEWTEEKHAPLTKFEKVQASVKPAMPAIVAGAVTVGCIIASGKEYKKQSTFFAGAAAVATKAYKEYRKKNIEINGAEADRKVAGEIYHAKNVPINAESFMEMTTLDAGTTEKEHVFYDTITKQKFVSSLNKVIEAEYHINRNLAQGAELTMDDWCNFIGIDKLDKGDRFGWNVCDDYLWVDFNHFKSTLDDGTECIVIDCVIPPVIGFDDWDGDIDDPWRTYWDMLGSQGLQEL